MTTLINANEKFGIETAKSLLKNPLIENGVLILKSEMFIGFGSMLTNVANPLSGCNQEAQDYIIKRGKELGIKVAKIVTN